MASCFEGQTDDLASLSRRVLHRECVRLSQSCCPETLGRPARPPPIAEVSDYRNTSLGRKVYLEPVY